MEVSDTVPGIRAECPPGLFASVGRLDSPYAKKTSGAGVGLVKRLVELHGGTVRARSEQGKGSGLIISTAAEGAAQEKWNEKMR
ncbi:MAG TPA: ATP-binding protein [Spirochaetota bacterium]|nr:ATP-binding protein [Spirochaetota bacterium]